MSSKKKKNKKRTEEEELNRVMGALRVSKSITVNGVMKEESEISELRRKPEILLKYLDLNVESEIGTDNLNKVPTIYTVGVNYNDMIKVGLETTNIVVIENLNDDLKSRTCIIL